VCRVCVEDAHLLAGAGSLLMLHAVAHSWRVCTHPVRVCCTARLQAGCSRRSLMR
jgi:hypothetical protein